jgi:hypothetical protein
MPKNTILYASGPALAFACRANSNFCFGCTQFVEHRIPMPTPREDRVSHEPSDGACEFAVKSHELRESGQSCAAAETILDGSSLYKLESKRRVRRGLAQKLG